MPVEKEPAVSQSREPRKLGKFSVGHFVELADGSVRRLPATMLRPPTWRESMLGRPATSIDIIGADEAFRQADELKELRAQFDHLDDDE